MENKIIEDLNVLDSAISKEEEERIWKAIANIDGAKDYFKDTMALDVRRYFDAVKEQQDFIKGAFSRTTLTKNNLYVII